MTAPASIPAAVRAAAAMSFSIGITAFLFSPELQGFHLVGRVFFDHKDRFKTGRLIRTSSVTEFIEINGYVVALTFSGSVYVLVAEDGPWPLSLPDDRGDAHAGHC
ncbi:hypothetical protein [Pseudomonas viridiflava]|uniref:hypothetical protein n=1 Tax=Pseudomonas viridiflava TaxID=33069 RepID=UPI000F03559C|nr:hypothetical protein [Pseudomonas viridiflava]